MPARVRTTPIPSPTSSTIMKQKKQQQQQRPAEVAPQAPTSPEPVELHVALKNARLFEYDKKLTAKRERRSRGRVYKAEPLRFNRAHMTLHPRGRWNVRLDDEVLSPGLMEDNDWVVPLETRVDMTMGEVPIVELLKPGKPRKVKQQVDDFEVVPAMPAVIILDDHGASEPEADEGGWECLDFDDDDLASEHSSSSSNSPPAHRAFSYAEVAANAP